MCLLPLIDRDAPRKSCKAFVPCKERGIFLLPHKKKTVCYLASERNFLTPNKNTLHLLL